MEIQDYEKILERYKNYYDRLNFKLDTSCEFFSVTVSTPIIASRYFENRVPEIGMIVKITRYKEDAFFVSDNSLMFLPTLENALDYTLDKFRKNGIRTHTENSIKFITSNS